MSDVFASPPKTAVVHDTLRPGAVVANLPSAAPGPPAPAVPDPRSKVSKNTKELFLVAMPGAPSSVLAPNRGAKGLQIQRSCQTVCLLLMLMLMLMLMVMMMVMMMMMIIVV